MQKLVYDFIKNRLVAEQAGGRGPVVTITRECGCSARRIAAKLSKILTGYSYLSDTKTEVEWKWISKEIIGENLQQMVKNTHHLGDEQEELLAQLAIAFSEENFYNTDDLRLTGITKSLIAFLASAGHFIIVGRASCLLTKDISQRLNIKLMASPEWRISRIMQLNNLSKAEAELHVKEVDLRREHYVESVAGRKPANHEFDLIFNYSTMHDDHIVDAIINVLKNKKIIVHAEEDL